MKKRNTLILDKSCINRLLDMKEAMQAVERAFSLFGKGKTQMPAKIYLDLKKFNGDFRAMPAFVEGMGAALKWVNVHPDNRRKHLPTVMATIILSDPKTGFPIAILDGTQITNYRTGAAGGVAAKYLARKKSSVIALIGCGEQAKTQLLAMETLYKIKQVQVWGHQRALVEAFVKSVGRKAYKIHKAKTIKECCHNADIIITTTPSRKALVKKSWLKKTAHINAIGADAPGKQELDVNILKDAKIVVDDWRQARHSGEINIALAKHKITKKQIYAEIAQIINKRKPGRTNKDGLSVFDSTGLAIQDVALSYQIYRKAKAKGLGHNIHLTD